ncbi:MAG: hypothetical protein NTV57_08350 [Cyanobacteria bacterium]|nr:hypothetical protein [Cyanobacteriota bacterium]
MVVIWPITAELACAHQQLFTLSSPVRLISVDPSRPLQNLALRVTRWLFSSLCLGLNRPADAGEAWGRPPRFAPRWMPFQWIQTCFEFEDSQHLAAPFIPLPALRQRVATRLNEARFVGAPLLGVHIRRSDHRFAIAYSDTSAFIAAMQEHLRRHPASRFLLCTDDPAEVVPMRTLFGNRLIWSPSACLDRSHQVAAIDALVDFLALAGCDAILGSHLSSFSLLAARYGGVPVTIAGAPQTSHAS